MAKPDLIRRRPLLAELKKRRGVEARKMQECSRAGYAINSGIKAVIVDTLDEVIALLEKAPRVAAPTGGTER